MDELRAPGAIVVGIDGSKAAIQAALWAVDEAVSRDVPLRLLYAIERFDGREAEADAMACELAFAETAVGRAFTTIEATGRPVKAEMEIVHGPPIESLIRASASAAMVCVGAIGLRHFQEGRMGSAASALAISARCPVAIVRGQHDPSGQSAQRIVVEVDESPDNGVLLGAAIEEALLRHGDIQAVICGRTVSGEDETVGDRALAHLDRRLAHWKRRYPDLQVESVAVRGSLMQYLAYNRRSVQLVIVGARKCEHLKELVGPVGSAILQDAECALLIVNRQHL